MTVLTRPQEAFAEELAEKHGVTRVLDGRSTYVIIEGGARTVDDTFAVAERFRVYADGTPLPAVAEDAECRFCPGLRATEPGGLCSHCYDEYLEAR